MRKPSIVAPVTERQHLRSAMLLATVLLLLAIPCSVSAQQRTDSFDRTSVAVQGSWPVAEPSTVGIDPEALEAMARRIEEGAHGRINAVVIVRDGQLVFERYFGGFTGSTLHMLQSVTKSVASTLIGLAIEHEYITDVHQPIQHFFPEYQHLFEADPRKGAITIHHLLTMTAGLDWPESGQSYGAENIVWQLSAAYDWSDFVLRRPMESAPGEVFNYSTGVSNLLGAIIQNATGMRTDRFAEHYLFHPLGIRNYGWFRNTQHSENWPHTGGGLHLTPRDLAKIGYLFASGGKWGDRQILSPEWTAVAVNPWLVTGRGPHESYGYQWWLRPLARGGGPSTAPNEVVHAAGIGGQHMFIVPALDLVVVFNSTNQFGAGGGIAREPLNLLYDDILPALQPQ
jgi:CubicO group peptidase (beta-lactamase class C family)